MRLTHVVLCVLTSGIIFCTSLVHGKTVSGTLSTKEEYLTQSLLLYWDKPNLWKSAYTNKTMTCQEKEGLVDISLNQIFRMNTDSSMCTMQSNDTIDCSTEQIKFVTARERWWYLVIANCDSDIGLQLDYEVVMRNGKPDEFFKQHFSADEFYILEFNIAAFFIELIMVVLVIVVSVKLTSMQMFHSTYKIFLSSVTFFFASIIVTCIAYLSYAPNGYDNSGLKRFGTALYAVSQVLLVLMLLLLSLGYTVVCGRLPHWGAICLSVFMTSFVIGYITLYIVEAVTFDTALVLYRYESSPGYGLMAIILASWVFYLGCCIFTMTKHKKKISFYAPMLVFYSLWFIAIPVTVAINMTKVPDHMRAKVVNFIEVISLFLAHVFYLVLTWPSFANKNFPFHIKTTQIDVISFVAATQMAEEEEEAAKKYSGDLPDGRQFTNFSIFTVPDQRSSFAPPADTATTGFGFGQDFGGGGGGGSGDSDWDSGVMMTTPAAADANFEAALPAGSVSGAARLVEGGVGFNFNSYDDVVDGENTVEQPVAPVPSSNDNQQYDNQRSETASLQEPPSPDAASVAAEGEDDEPVAVQSPEWMRRGPFGSGGDSGASRGGLLPPV